MELDSEGISSQARMIVDANVASWHANEFLQGQFVEPIHTASPSQRTFSAMSAQEVVDTDWIGLERKSTKMDQDQESASIGPGRTERRLQQPKVRMEDQRDVDAAALRGCQMVMNETVT